MFQSLWHSGMSLYVGDLVDNEIGQPKPTCNCGDSTACKGDIENIRHYYLEIKDIQLDKARVDYSKFRPEFYRSFDNTLKEQFPNAFWAGNNLAIICQEKEFNVPELVEKFQQQLLNKGYSFKQGELSDKKGDNLPLQFDDTMHSQFVDWLEENNPTKVEETSLALGF